MGKHKKHDCDTSYLEMTTVVMDEPSTVINDTAADVVTPAIEEPKPVIGVVTGCNKLNVRKMPKPDAAVVSELVASSEVMIDEDKSTVEFYKVCTASGVEGFCMKKFITIQD